MEKYNFKATILSYADKFEKEDTKFLSPKDLLTLERSSFWELGTNGYRLEFINVFDKDNVFLGNLNSLEFAEKSADIKREYNHYLMDFIRDENNIPKESYEEMKKRIDFDYEALSEIYSKEIERVPQLYALMHSNTGAFGSNGRVSEINEQWIKTLFKMNFNREGYSLNTTESSIYDLTRMQPQAYWSTNHLLMRIWGDTGQELQFIIGDEEQASKFDEVSGRAEFKDNTITLTSIPEGTGMLKLKGSEGYKDIKVSASLRGNVIGSQGIYLRFKDEDEKGIFVQLINNKVNVIEEEKVIFSKDLSEFDGALEEPLFDIRTSGDRKLDITLVEDKISISIDGKVLVENLQVNTIEPGSVYLQSAWGEYGYSERNLVDDVYDGIFKDVEMRDINNNILYTNRLMGIDSLMFNIKMGYNKIVNWFIKYL